VLQKKIQAVKRKIHSMILFIELKFRVYRAILLNAILLYNVFWSPLNLAYRNVTHTGIIFVMEILTLLILSMNFLVDLKDYRNQRKKLVQVMVEKSLPTTLLLDDEERK